LHVKKEERKVAWSDIDYTEPDDTIKRNYATMWNDHVVKPDDDMYSYVLLPGKSEEEVGAYAKDPDIDVIRNDGDVQAVADTNEQILGANFWKDEKQTARSEEHTSELQSRFDLVCRLLLAKKKDTKTTQ